jgi:hypothetical protein
VPSHQHYRRKTQSADEALALVTEGNSVDLVRSNAQIRYQFDMFVLTELPSDAMLWMEPKTLSRKLQERDIEYKKM